MDFLSSSLSSLRYIGVMKIFYITKFLIKTGAFYQAQDFLDFVSIRRDIKIPT